MSSAASADTYAAKEIAQLPRRGVGLQSYLTMPQPTHLDDTGTIGLQIETLSSVATRLSSRILRTIH